MFQFDNLIIITSLVNCIVCHMSAPTASFRTCKSKQVKVEVYHYTGDDDDQSEDALDDKRVARDAPGRSHCSERINLQNPLHSVTHLHETALQRVRFVLHYGSGTLRLRLYCDGIIVALQ